MSTKGLGRPVCFSLRTQVVRLGKVHTPAMQVEIGRGLFLFAPALHGGADLAFQGAALSVGPESLRGSRTLLHRAEESNTFGGRVVVLTDHDLSHYRRRHSKPLPSFSVPWAEEDARR